MTRYIDADALGIGKANRDVFEHPKYADGWNSAIEIINNAPTADVAPKSEVAREIFAEIETIAKIYTFPVVKNGIVEIVKEPFWCIEPSDLTKLKKKYTEGWE